MIIEESDYVLESSGGSLFDLKLLDTKKKKDGTKTRSSRKPTSISISKIDESYNTDKAPDTLTSKEDMGEYNRTEHDNKGDLQDIPSEGSSVYASSKVRNKI